MISGRNPNRTQKKLLMVNNKNCNEWLVIKTIQVTVNGYDTTAYQFRHKTTNEIICISVDGDIVSE